MYHWNILTQKSYVQSNKNNAFIKKKAKSFTGNILSCTELFAHDTELLMSRIFKIIY